MSTEGFERPNKVVHVIIPTRNRPKLLRRALSSVVKQTFLPQTVVVVNDSDDEFRDETSKEIASFDDRNINSIQITEVLNQTKHGLSISINMGLNHLKTNTHVNLTDFVALLDDDDWWDAKYIETCVNSIEIESNTGTPNWIISGLIRYDVNNPQGIEQPVPKEEEIIVKTFLLGNPNIQGSNLFLQLGLFDKIGGFDEDLQSLTDRDICIRLIQEESTIFKIIQKHLVHHWAFDTLPRLSTPGTISKKKGLKLFYQKYAYLMTDEIKQAFKNRAKKLFSIDLK